MLDGDPAPSKKGAETPPQFSAHLLWPNGWMDQDGTWHGARPQPRRLCVRWGLGTPSPPQKGSGAPSPIFGKFLLSQNGWMHHDATWYGGRPQPRGLCVRWGPSPLPKKGAEPPNFQPIFIVAKRLDESRWHLAWRWALVQATLY